MATIFKPFGLSCVGYAGASKPRPGATYDFPIQDQYNETIGNGDPVALTGGYITIATAASAYPPGAANEIILGVFQQVSYQPAQSQTAPAKYPYWLAGTKTLNKAGGLVSVNIDPMQIYNIQANGQVDQTHIGNCFNLGGFTSTNTSTGNSVVYLIAATLGANTNYGQVKLLGLAPVTPEIQALGGNAWSDQYPILQVVLNSSQLKSGQYSEN